MCIFMLTLVTQIKFTPIFVNLGFTESLILNKGIAFYMITIINKHPHVCF